MSNLLDTNWNRFEKYYREYPEIGLAIDISRVAFPADFFGQMAPAINEAFLQMDRLEAGSIANPDEQRMVGHYWLRNPDLAPDADIAESIRRTIDEIEGFVRRVHNAEIKGANGKFENVLLIGIGGSALGPQFVSRALGHPAKDKMAIHFFDNTDPDGIDLVLARLEGQLGRTLCIVVSKSGGTKETENGMKEAMAAYNRASLAFEQHAVAVTVPGSKLDRIAKGTANDSKPWLTVFPMWDWVGGRTSETSAVGLLPAALQGIDIRALLNGAKACDALTRVHNALENPAAQLALMWYHIGKGRGQKDMVVLPYKDRLELFARYLQQLVMESLGKERDLDGNVVNQGITVYGNKGSTDQHAYVQQLREGLHNFFVVFIEVLKDRDHALPNPEVEPGITSGDYLHGFLLGTRQALYDRARESITITINDITPFTVGALIALFERAVGLYASLININAYHQPGVAAGKKAANDVLSLQARIQALFAKRAASQNMECLTARRVAEILGCPTQSEMVFKICQRLAANPGRGIKRSGGQSASDACFQPESQRSGSAATK